jgi:hypothetical protein
VLPIQINATAEGGFGIHESDAGDREFASLHELIAYYTAYLLQVKCDVVALDARTHACTRSRSTRRYRSKFGFTATSRLRRRRRCCRASPTARSCYDSRRALAATRRRLSRTELCVT